MSVNDIDWKLCVICQRGGNLRCTEKGLTTLAENLLEIWKLGELDDFDWQYVAEFENDGPNFLKSFKENDAKYHHDCASKYSTQKASVYSRKEIVKEKNPTLV